MTCGVSASSVTWRASLSELGSRLFSQSASHGPRKMQFESDDQVSAHGVAFDVCAALRSHPSFCFLQRLNARKGAKPHTA